MDRRELIVELCRSMKDDCAALIMEASSAIQQQCGLSQEETNDIVPALALLATGVVTRSVDMFLEIAREVNRK